MISAEEIKALMEPDTRPKDDPSFYEKDDFVPALTTLQTLLNQAAEALEDISGKNDVDGNSMACDTHEECQNSANKTLAAISPYLTKEGE